MLLLERTPLSMIPAPKSWAAQRGQLLQKAGLSPERHIAIIYYCSPRQAEEHGILLDPHLAMSLRSSQGCLRAAQARGVEVSFMLHDGSPERLEEVKRWLKTASIGGVLIVQRVSSFKQFHEIVDPLLAAGLPVVNVFGDVQGADIISVDFNNVSGGFHGAMDLIARGCQRITVLAVQLYASHSGLLRLEGARLAAKQAGVEFRILEGVVEDGEVFLPPFYEESWRPEGVLALTHDIGSALIKMGLGTLTCGEDYHCIAFSSSSETPWGVEMDLLKMDFEAVGEAATGALLSAMEGAKVHRTLLIPLPVCRAERACPKIS